MPTRKPLFILILYKVHYLLLLLLLIAFSLIIEHLAVEECVLGFNENFSHKILLTSLKDDLKSVIKMIRPQP